MASDGAFDLLELEQLRSSLRVHALYLDMKDKHIARAERENARLRAELDRQRAVVEAARKQLAEWAALPPAVVDRVGLELGTGPAAKWASATASTEAAVRLLDGGER